MTWLIALILFGAPLIFALFWNKPIRKSYYINYSSSYYIIIAGFWNLFTETTPRFMATFQVAVWLVAFFVGLKLLEKKELYLPEENASTAIVHPDAAWRCLHCGTVNDRFFVECKKCGAAFAEEKVNEHE